MGGFADQMRLGPLHEVGVEVVGEVVDGAEDRFGLLHMQATCGERLPGGLVVVEAVGEPELAVRGGPGGPGGVGDPVGGGLRPDLVADLGRSSVGQERVLSSASWASRRAVCW